MRTVRGAGVTVEARVCHQPTLRMVSPSLQQVPPSGRILILILIEIAQVSNSIFQQQPSWTTLDQGCRKSEKRNGRLIGVEIFVMELGVGDR